MSENDKKLFWWKIGILAVVAIGATAGYYFFG